MPREVCVRLRVHGVPSQESFFARHVRASSIVNFSSLLEVEEEGIFLPFRILYLFIPNFCRRTMFIILLDREQ